MASPSPACTVQSGAGAIQTTVPFDVNAGDVITVQLASLAGVSAWSFTIYGQDDAVAPPTVTVNNTTKTATFTAPAAPWTLIYKSQVNNGVDVNGVAQPSYTTTVGIHSKTGPGQRLVASNETTESNTSLGWTKKVNDAIRNSGGVTAPLTLTGTSDTPQLVVVANATQTTQLTQWKSSGGAVLLAISANGSALQWGEAVTLPALAQVQAVTNTAGAQMSVLAQAAKSGGGGAGGALKLAGGAGDGAGASGPVNLFTGATQLASLGLVSSDYLTVGASTATCQIVPTGLTLGITAAPNLQQTTAASGATPNNFTVTPQAPNAGSGTTASGTPGSFVVNFANPVSTGVQASLNLQVGGSNIIQMGHGPFSAGFHAIWFGNVAQTTGNYAFLGDGVTFSILNVPTGGSILLRVNNSTVSSFGGQSTDYVGLGVGPIGSGYLRFPAATATGSGLAVTLNASPGVITTESLSTAAGASVVYTITNSQVAATSRTPAVSVGNGTNTGGEPGVTSVTVSANTLKVTIRNFGSTALNGTLLISIGTPVS